jgi:hypothetical protein
MNASSISEVLSAWEAASRSVGRNLPAGIVERGLAFLPDSPEWAISEDASELFALTAEDVLFSLGLSSDSEWRLRSRPLYADRLLVRLSWSQPRADRDRRTDLEHRLDVRLPGGARARRVATPARIRYPRREWNRTRRCARAVCQGNRDASRVGAPRLSR